MDLIFNPITLRLVRQSMGESQKDFAEKVLQVKQAVLSKYENGIIVPPDAVLDKLEHYTLFPRSFFFQTGTELPSGLVFHRKRNSLSSRIRERIEAEVRLRALDVMTLFKETGTKSDIIERNGLSAQEMAIELRKTWKLGNNPIDNMVSLLEKHNIVILKFDFDTDKLDAFFMPLPSGVICIALNSNTSFSADRQRFSLAHELGHALLHKDQVPDETLEKEADEFAADFLFPVAEAQMELKQKLSFALLKELKAKWKISMQAILFKGHKLGLIDERTYKRYYIYFSSQGYRKNEPPCGVENEKPSLLYSILSKYMQMHQEFIACLNLSQEKFYARYPDINMEVTEDA